MGLRFLWRIDYLAVDVASYLYNLSETGEKEVCGLSLFRFSSLVFCLNLLFLFLSTFFVLYCLS